MRRRSARCSRAWTGSTNDLPASATWPANGITEADIRLFTTLVRFDPVYVGHFKCNLRRIADYPNLSAYLRDLYQLPGIAETVNIHHIKPTITAATGRSTRPASCHWDPCSISMRPMTAQISSSSANRRRCRRAFTIGRHAES